MNRRFPFHTAFTLVELLVVLAVIGALAALLLPVVAHAKASSQSVSCLSNLRQLQLAYLSYAHDHGDAIPPNISRRIEFDQVSMPGSWVVGNALIDTTAANIASGVLYSYLNSAGVYHCPSDKSTVRDSSLKRTRSYSMSLWLNTDITIFGNADLVNDDKSNRRKLSEFIDPPPSDTWVLIDEHELSIDDGVFLIVNSDPNEPNQNVAWSSYRGDRHRNGANLSFADGRVEHYAWKCRRDFPPYTQSWVPPVNEADLDDLRRLTQGVPRPR